MIFIGLWSVMENVFCVVFFVKLVLRSIYLKLDYFKDRSTKTMTTCTITSLRTFESPCLRPFLSSL